MIRNLCFQLNLYIVQNKYREINIKYKNGH